MDKMGDVEYIYEFLSPDFNDGATKSKEGTVRQWNIFSAQFLLAMVDESRSSEKIIKYSKNC